MRLLTDTHTFLWYISNDPKLSTYAAETLENPLNQPVLSLASLWDMKTYHC